MTSIIDISVYWLLIELFHIWYLLSSALTGFVVLLFHYSANRIVTFKGGGQKREQIPRYLILVVFNYVVGLGILYFWVDIIGVHYMIGNILKILSYLLYTYTIMKKFVFK